MAADSSSVQLLNGKDAERLYVSHLGGLFIHFIVSDTAGDHQPGGATRSSDWLPGGIFDLINDLENVNEESCVI